MTQDKQEPNPEWEAKYNEAHAKQVAKLGVDPEATLKMLETWKSDAEPANELGQASFSRAMLESATDALSVTIAASRLLIEAGKALDKINEWAKHDLATANQLQPDLYAYDDGSEADVTEFEGNGTSPLLWGDLREIARVSREIAALTETKP